MSSVFKLPLKGEMLLSAVWRVQDRFHHISEMLAHELSSLQPSKGCLLPQGLRAHCETLPHVRKPTPDEILLDCTAWLFAAPFLTRNEAAELRDIMMAPPVGYSPILAKAGSLLEFKGRKFCPECVTEDIGRAGIPTFRVQHQLGDLVLCPEHLCELSMCCNAWEKEKRCSLATSLRRPVHFMKELSSTDCDVAIATMVRELMANRLWGIGPGLVRAASDLTAHKQAMVLDPRKKWECMDPTSDSNGWLPKVRRKQGLLWPPADTPRGAFALCLATGISMSEFFARARGYCEPYQFPE